MIHPTQQTVKYYTVHFLNWIVLNTIETNGQTVQKTINANATT